MVGEMKFKGFSVKQVGKFKVYKVGNSFTISYNQIWLPGRYSSEAVALEIGKKMSGGNWQAWDKAVRGTEARWIISSVSDVERLLDEVK